MGRRAGLWALTASLFFACAKSASASGGTGGTTTSGGGGSAGCSSANCTTCCEANTCNPYGLTNDQHCGKNGAACKNCSTFTQWCNNGVCSF